MLFEIKLDFIPLIYFPCLHRSIQIIKSKRYSYFTHKRQIRLKTVIVLPH